MVCSTAWSDDTKPNLFTCGFDKITYGWSIQHRESFKENDAGIQNSITGASQTPIAASNSGPTSLEGIKYLRNVKDA